MVFDLTFEEAIDILKNKVGWVQGENFDEHEYLALDRLRNIFIKKEPWPLPVNQTISTRKRNRIYRNSLSCRGRSTGKPNWIH